MSEAKRKLPSTSIDAFKALTPEKLSGDYKKIIDCLKSIGSGTYEQISDFLNCREPNVISRRMSELERMELVWKPGTKKLTKRNRFAYVYQLTGNHPKTENELPKELTTPQNTTKEAQGLDNGKNQGSFMFDF